MKGHTAAYHNSEYSYHLTNSPIFLNGITILKRNPFWKPKGIDLHIFLELIEEGNRDGSIHTEYANEIAELMPLLTSLWMLPSVFPGTKEDMKHKFLFIGEMLEKMGVPLFDQEILQIVDEFFDQFPETTQKE